MEERSTEDFIIAGAVVLIVFVSFIAVLYLNKRSSKSSGDARTPRAKSSLPEGEIGTVFVKEDDGRVVRRSTRQHKPVTPLGVRLAAAADAEGERDTGTPKLGGRTPRASSSRSPAPAAAAEPVTPRSTRRGRPPKTAIA